MDAMSMSDDYCYDDYGCFSLHLSDGAGGCLIMGLKQSVNMGTDHDERTSGTVKYESKCIYEDVYVYVMLFSLKLHMKTSTSSLS